MRKVVASFVLLLSLSSFSNTTEKQSLNRPTGGDFSIEASTSKNFKLSDLKGNVAFVYFGYTRCPNVCPLTVQRLKKLQSTLELNKKSDARFLFISVDNAVDTPKILKRYAKNNGKLFISATAPDEKLREIIALYGGHFSKIKNNLGKTLIDHSDSVYVISPSGLWVNSLKYDRPYEEFLKAYEDAKQELNSLPKRPLRVEMNSLGKSESCDLGKKTCSFKLPDGSPLEVTLSPYPIKTEKEFTISAKTTSKKFTPKLMDFVGVEQNMGLIRPEFNNSSQGTFTAKIDLPICEQRKMKWKTRLVLSDESSNLHFVEFLLETQD